MYSEGSTALQKSLFLHTFLYESSLFFSKRMKEIQAIKITVMRLFLLILQAIFKIITQRINFFHDLNYVVKHSFRIIFFNKRFNFCYSFRMFLYFFTIQCDCYSVLKAFIAFLLLGFIVFFLFFSQARESIYDPQRLKFTL